VRRWLVAFSFLVASCRGCDEPARLPEDGASAVEADAAPDVSAPIVPIMPVCEGMKLVLFDAVMDARCSVTDEEWAVPPPVGIAQEAKLVGGDAGVDQVEFAFVNRGKTPASLPIRFDDRHPERTFEVIAEMLIDGGGIYAVQSPALALNETDGGVHVHSARIRLPPGGRAFTRLKLDRRPRERLDKHVDAGVVLPSGPVRFHIGQTMSPAEVGDPAVVLP
jgi:hypothetical protein